MYSCVTGIGSHEELLQLFNENANVFNLVINRIVTKFDLLAKQNRFTALEAPSLMVSLVMLSTNKLSLYCTKLSIWALLCYREATAMYRYGINVVIIWGDNLFTMYVLFSHHQKYLCVWLSEYIQKCFRIYSLNHTQRYFSRFFTRSLGEHRMNLRTVILQSPMILSLSTPPRVFPAVGKYRQQC